MKIINTNKILKNRIAGYALISASALVLVYLLIALYFTRHFLFNTIINGVNVSAKAYDYAEYAANDYIKDYILRLAERGGNSEAISGRDIAMRYNKDNSIKKVNELQNPLLWLGSLFKERKYYVEDLYHYNKTSLDNIIDRLDCMNLDIKEPQNVKFIFSDGAYEAVEGNPGNKVNKERLTKVIELYISLGKKELNLEEKHCYEIPRYTLESDKTHRTKSLLNKYVSARIIYQFGNETEVLDGYTINKWLSVDDNLDVVISKNAVTEYIKNLSDKYDTVGAVRSFKASSGKTIEVKGGLYGWKINRKAEIMALTDNINRGEILEKEPIYSLKALYRDKDDIGNTYIEINLTKQHLWFYKDGELITSGYVVTGNPAKGNATVVGTYKVVYKEKDATLSGPGYDVNVTYWMPFYGNMGIHDARWRSQFGGEIYKSRGTHGCVNAPYNLAKTIYENIEEGTPVIIYKEN